MIYDLMVNDFCVPMEGLEPPYLAASDPKSDVSTNFTTWALRGAKVMDLMEMIRTERFLMFIKECKLSFTFITCLQGSPNFPLHFYVNSY